jgi:hypothetical protein
MGEWLENWDIEKEWLEAGMTDEEKQQQAEKKKLYAPSKKPNEVVKTGTWEQVQKHLDTIPTKKKKQLLESGHIWVESHGKSGPEIVELDFKQAELDSMDLELLKKAGQSKPLCEICRKSRPQARLEGIQVCADCYESLTESE